jgi:hypothetical protein
MLNVIARVVLVVAGFVAMVLGVHGLVVYFSRWEILFGSDPLRLFLAIDMPSGLRSWVEWMSIKGFQSWGVPVVFIIIAILLWYAQSRIELKTKQT